MEQDTRAPGGAQEQDAGEMFAAGPWISVRDRLPSILVDRAFSDKVLTYNGDYLQTARFSTREEWCGDSGFRLTRVTHWAEISIPEVQP